MITKKENIAAAFYAFHDGDIIFDKEEKSNQIWRINCEYLAEMINVDYKFFWLKIYECRFLQFSPWMNPIELPKEIWIEKEKIFKTELEILSAKAKGNKVEISCNQHDLGLTFCGGELLIDCLGIEIFDEEWNKLEEEDLGRICNKYWNRED